MLYLPELLLAWLIIEILYFFLIKKDLLDSHYQWANQVTCGLIGVGNLVLFIIPYLDSLLSGYFLEHIAFNTRDSGPHWFVHQLVKSFILFFLSLNLFLSKQKKENIRVFTFIVVVIFIAMQFFHDIIFLSSVDIYVRSSWHTVLIEYKVGMIFLYGLLGIPLFNYLIVKLFYKTNKYQK